MRKISSVALMGFVLSALVTFAFAQSPDAQKIHIYFFWGDGCPHCEDQKPFLKDLEARYPQVEVKSLETWYEQDNAKLYAEMARAYGSRQSGVPATFLDDKVWVGYRAQTGRRIERKVQECIESGGCADPMERLQEPRSR